MSKMTKKKKVSLIIPCFNEEATLIRLYDALNNCTDNISGYLFEYIFIDDGSRDRTFEILKRISGDGKVNYIKLSRNFGKESAMFAGLEAAKGEAVIIMDADLQHPPELIANLLEKYEQGFDQVVAKRTRDGEHKGRRVITQLYYKIINRFIDVELNDGFGDFRLLSRKAVNALLALQETNRFSKGLFSWIGFETATIEFTNRVREAGQSKFSFRGLLNYAIDGLLSFNSKPLRLLIYTALVILSVSLMYILYILFGVLVSGVEVPGYFTLISAILLLSSVQLLSIGVLGEYIGRIYIEIKRRPNYLVSETNIDKDKTND